LSQGDSERSLKPPNAHSLGRYVQQQKKKKVTVVLLNYLERLYID